MLHLHVPTLLAAAAMVNVTLTFFCLNSWRGGRDRKIYKWLAITGAASSVGFVILLTHDQASPTLHLWAAQACFLLGAGTAWAGIRVFEGRAPRRSIIGAGAAIWAVAYFVPGAIESVTVRAAICSTLVAAYYLATAYELIRGYRAEPFDSRLVSIGATLIHVVVVLGRIALALTANLMNWQQAEASNSIGLFVMETIIVMITLVLSLTTMERDRVEIEQRNAASTDVLTGARSRRAFLEGARDWVEAKGKDAALILFDLDHFKRINDTYGHAAGDQALIAFSRLVTARLQCASMIAGFNLDESTSDQYPRWYEATIADAAEGGQPLFGRIGGEEFACLLPHLSLPQSLAIAEDIRQNLGELDVAVGTESLRMSVSAAVVTTADIGHHLDEMFAAADQALYRAKHAGRNRIETGKPVINMAVRKSA